MLDRLNLRFAVILLSYGGAIFFLYRDEVLGSILAPLAAGTARLVFALLDSLGVDALREGAVITHPDGFAYEISYICTGLLPVVTFLVCVLAYPAAWRTKWLGMLIAVPILWAINLLRLVSLFWIGVHFPAAFAWAHEVVWEGLLAVTFISLWLGWMNWSGRRIKSSA